MKNPLCLYENIALSCLGFPRRADAMPTKTSDGEILTIKQVADYLKVTERTIYRLAAAKKIPAFKVGGTWRFSRAEIDQWIKQQSSAVEDDR
jgi:excisionase family DNA binding protein